MEEGETGLEAARRELWEETGAKIYELTPVCIYSTDGHENNEEVYGALFYADITKFGEMPDFEMERIELFDSMPERFTYPDIQPHLMKKICERIGGLGV